MIIIPELKISNDQAWYNRSKKRFSTIIKDFIFIGQYKKSTLIGNVLNDIYDSLKKIIQIERKTICFWDVNDSKPIEESIKLKKLSLKEEGVIPLLSKDQRKI